MSALKVTREIAAINNLGQDYRIGVLKKRPFVRQTRRLCVSLQRVRRRRIITQVRELLFTFRELAPRKAALLECIQRHLTGTVFAFH